MTNDQADELLKNNDWAKWSDARWLLMEAAHMGAMDERKNLDAELRRLKAENQRLQNKLQNKRTIFQAGRDSYETACVPYNTDDEAWEKFIATSKKAEAQDDL